MDGETMVKRALDLAQKEVFELPNKGKKITLGGVEFLQAEDRHTYMVWITPEQARQVLDRMTDGQRKLSIAKVSEYAVEMVKERWHVSNDALVCYMDQWLNGQHRLHAVIESGKPQIFGVTVANTGEVFKVIDGGIPRSVAVVAGMMKMPDGTIVPGNFAVSAIAAGILQYEKKMQLQTNPGRTEVFVDERKVSRRDRIDFIEANAERIVEISRLIKNWGNKWGWPLTEKVAGVAFHAIATKYGDEVAIRYLEGIFKGSGPAKAQLELCRILYREANTKSRLFKLPMGTKLGLVLKAFICYRTHRPVGQLRFRVGEKTPEI